MFSDVLRGKNSTEESKHDYCSSTCKLNRTLDAMAKWSKPPIGQQKDLGSIPSLAKSLFAPKGQGGWKK